MCSSPDHLKSNPFLLVLKLLPKAQRYLEIEPRLHRSQLHHLDHLLPSALALPTESIALPWVSLMASLMGLPWVSQVSLMRMLDVQARLSMRLPEYQQLDLLRPKNGRESQLLTHSQSPLLKNLTSSQPPTRRPGRTMCLSSGQSLFKNLVLSSICWTLRLQASAL